MKYNPFSDDNLHHSYDFRRNKNNKKLIIVIGLIVILALVFYYDVGGIKTSLKETNQKTSLIAQKKIIDNSTEKEEEFFENIKDKVTPEGISCKEDLDEKIEIYRIKLGSMGSISIKETKIFNNLGDAEEYIKLWDSLWYKTAINKLRNIYSSESNEIPIIIARSQYKIDGTTLPQIIIYTCDDDKRVIL